MFFILVVRIFHGSGGVPVNYQVYQDFDFQQKYGTFDFNPLTCNMANTPGESNCF